MKKQVLFIQGGGGEKDHAADEKLVDSLTHLLGSSYVVHFPLLENESVPDFGRLKQIDKALNSIDDQVILIGHSLGASMILKYLSASAGLSATEDLSAIAAPAATEDLSATSIQKKIDAIFLISTPFWSGDEDWKQPLILSKDFADHISKSTPIFLYHAEDDQEVPIEHLNLYAKHLPQATIRKLASGGHQLGNDLKLVAKDIMNPLNSNLITIADAVITGAPPFAD